MAGILPTLGLEMRRKRFGLTSSWISFIKCSIRLKKLKARICSRRNYGGSINVTNNILPLLLSPLVLQKYLTGHIFGETRFFVAAWKDCYNVI